MHGLGEIYSCRQENTSMKKMRIVALGFIFLVFAAFLSLASAPLSLHPPSAPIPPEYFGMHFHRLDSVTSWPKDIDVHSWRLLGTYIMWPNIEPEKGKWNFALLDK